MDAAWSQAFALVFDPYNIFVMLAASLFGLFVGAVPGLTATMATALLVPVTFFMAPIPAIAAIVTATAMAIFSGDIPGCLMRMPGTPASAAYTDEAYAMTRKGQAELALGAGLVFSAPDDIDWDDEVRMAIEARAAFSPDALTGMEANLRFAGPETMETKIFGRLTAWQNWIFIRPNAVGEKGALTSYGSQSRPEFDFGRT